MESVRGNINNPSFNSITRQGEDGNAAGQFASWSRVEMSGQDGRQLHPDHIDHTSDQEHPKLNQRGCVECQQQPRSSLPRQSGPSSVSPALESALHAGDMQALEQSLKISSERGVNIHEYGHLLFIALETENFAGFKRLCEAGVNVNVTNEMGQTPLHTTAFEGKEDYLQLLIDFGAKVNVGNDCGYTPLHEACMNDNVGCAQRLINCQANVNAVGIFRHTPMLLAVYNDSSNCLKLLIDFGARVNGANIIN
ncbi:ankyrin repeat domain-containing protein [Endozoicomonas sp. ONNA2]|uniref:ankyrin repeat domain-containing protein n=1 Tax=Endozoicomonas sp. ONNA2 TaxID=2828741 RepID=UPI00214837F1|nr:ankyrin repeat domain-containing protein [Endozoicomonas sp. ONNA2]